jgi:hypothetical protein
MEVWGRNKLKDPNSNHIIRKVLKRKEQLLTREQTPKVIKELAYLKDRLKIGQMLLERWKENHLENRSQNRLDNRL